MAVVVVLVVVVAVNNVVCIDCVEVQAEVSLAQPFRACQPLINAEELVDKIVIVERGDCMFIDKVGACSRFIIFVSVSSSRTHTHTHTHTHAACAHIFLCLLDELIWCFCQAQSVTATQFNRVTTSVTLYILASVIYKMGPWTSSSPGRAP